MIDIWIPVTIAGAFFQNIRSAIQKHLTGSLSGQGAAYSRFLFALPWAILYLVFIGYATDSPIPETNLRFTLYVIAGSISQILATVFLIRTFAYRSFAVGTTFSKLEVVIVAILGVFLLGDTLGTIATTGITLSAAGLLALSAGQNRISLGTLLEGIKSRATILGLLAAFFLGASVIFFRGASLSLDSQSALLSAAFTLMVALTIQTLTMGIYLAIVEAGELKRVLLSWRWSIPVGIAGVLASICWFTAFTLQNASYVRALGQIELLFTFIVTTRIFREHVTKLELLGCLLIIVGITALLLA